jgi:enoyl-CoA hydratase
VNRVFPEDQLKDATLKTAKKIASKGRVSMRACKELIHFGYDMPLDHGLPWKPKLSAPASASPDQKEGMSAFLEKRKADFKGEA